MSAVGYILGVPALLVLAAIRRGYMAGALDALTSGADRQALIAECIAFGRLIGTEHEGALAR